MDLNESVKIYQAIKSAMFHHQFADNNESSLVITEKPWLWSDSLDFDRIIDIRQILQIPSQPAPRSDDLQENVYFELLSVGWPGNSIFRQHTYAHQETNHVVDFAVFSGNSWKQAIIINPAVNSCSEAYGLAFEIFKRCEAECISFFNGQKYFLCRRRTTQATETNIAPDLAMLGGDSKPKHAYTLASLETVNNLINENKVSYLILDYCRSAQHRVSSLSSTTNCLQEYVSVGPISVAQALLLELSKRASLRKISFIAQRKEAGSPNHLGFREELASRFSPKAVLEMPQHLYYEPQSTGRVLILSEKTKSETFFVQIPTKASLLDYQNAGWWQSMDSWFKKKRPEDGWYCQLQDNTSWEARANRPEISHLQRKLGKIGCLEKLGKIATLFVGDFSDPIGEARDGDTPLVTADDLNLTGVSDGFNIRHWLKPHAADKCKFRLQTNDILVPKHFYADSEFVINRALADAAVSNDVLIIRPGQNTSPEFLAEYLNSKVARDILCSRAKMHEENFILSRSELANLEVPMPEEQSIKLFSELAQAEYECRQRLDDFLKQKQQLFSAGCNVKFSSSLQKAVQDAKMLQFSLSEANSLEFRIKNFYPFPLAYIYRTQASIVHSTDRYREQLRLVEAMLAFLASVSLSLLNEQDIATLDLLSHWMGGASDGKWQKLLGKCATLLSRYPDSTIGKRLRELKPEGGSVFGDAVKSLIEGRNDFHHNRCGTISELEVEETNILIKTCLEQLAFLVELPLRQVRDFDKKRDGTFRLTCWRLSGDHPGFAQEVETYESTLPKNDIFVDLGKRSWRSLYPYVIAESCDKCKSREIYFIEKFDKQTGRATLKSFEHGHEHESIEIGEEIAKKMGSMCGA